MDIVKKGQLSLLAGSIATLLLSTGCPGGGGSSKYPTAAPCSGSGVLEGTWVTATQVGVIYDNLSTTSDITGCKSTNYDFQIQIAGNREPDIVLNMTVWGGIFESGDIQTRNWQDNTPWVTNPASHFEAFTPEGHSAQYDGEVQLSCGTTDDITFTCQPKNDLSILLGQITIKVDSTDPNKATVDLWQDGNVFLGSADAVLSDRLTDCRDAKAQSDKITIVRTDPSSDVLDNGMYELADFNQVDCPTSQEAMPTEPDRATTYNNKNVLQWLKLVRDWWGVNKSKTLAQQKVAAHTTITQYVLQPERAKVEQFVDDLLVNYNAADPAACYLPQIDAHCRVKLLVDSAYDDVQLINIDSMTSTQHAVVDNTAWAFGKMYKAWDTGQ